MLLALLLLESFVSLISLVGDPMPLEVFLVGFTAACFAALYVSFCGIYCSLVCTILRFFLVVPFTLKSDLYSGYPRIIFFLCIILMFFCFFQEKYISKRNYARMKLNLFCACFTVKFIFSFRFVFSVFTK